MKKISYFIDTSSENVKILNEEEDELAISIAKSRFYLWQKKKAQDRKLIAADFIELIKTVSAITNTKFPTSTFNLVFNEYNRLVESNNKKIKKLLKINIKSLNKSMFVKSAVKFLKRYKNVNYYQAIIIMTKSSFFNYSQYLEKNPNATQAELLHYFIVSSQIPQIITKNIVQYLESMKYLYQQDCELQYLLRYGNYHALPDEWIKKFKLIEYYGKLGSKEKNGPDFIFCNDEKRVGVEATRLTLPIVHEKEHKSAIEKPAQSARIGSLDSFIIKVFETIKEKDQTDYKDESKYAQCDSLKLLIVLDPENLSIDKNWIFCVQAFLNVCYKFKKLKNFDEVVIA